ncbi:MAG: trigger factor family protein [Bacteroidales bacterium]|nr:trigger factor family protein [Bacteroidales bacterium]
MNVKEKKIDALNRELTIEVAAADYAEIEKKKLADRRRTAEFKGFRKGMVPASLIKRVYGEQALVESVNQVIGQALDKHITDKKLRILGEPLASEKQPQIEWEDGNDFTFVFDLGLSPEVNVEVEAADTVPSYTVTVTAKDKAPMVENLKKYYEEHKEEGQEAKSDDELDKEVSERLKNQYASEAEWRMTKDIRNFYINKAGVELPEAFLKRWLIEANGGKLTAEDVEKDFAGFAEDFKWQLVRGSLMQKWGFKVEEKDLTEQAEAFARYQYAMYGIGNVPDEMVKEMAVNMLQDQKQVERLVEQVEDRKVLDKIKETITLKATKISAAKFREL